MKGTFRPGDHLYVDAVGADVLRPGDIVVFTRESNSSRKEIVHRVICRLPDGLVTRGDAVAHEDYGLVTEPDLLGVVRFKERNGRISNVHGGCIGFYRGRGLHFYWGIRRNIVRWMQKPYTILKNSRLISWIWMPKITCIHLKSPKGPLLHFLYNKRIVARYWPKEDRFECRKPWDLVIRPKDDQRIKDLCQPFRS